MNGQRFVEDITNDDILIDTRSQPPSVTSRTGKFYTFTYSEKNMKIIEDYYSESKFYLTDQRKQKLQKLNEV